MAGLALFDLDNTLVDRLGAFQRWATGFVAARGGDDADLAWLLATDQDGETPLRKLFEAVKERFGLEETPDQLVAAYRGVQATFYDIDPKVVNALRRLRSAGWRSAIVTNGAPVQRKKARRAGLLELVDGLCISEEVGARKPDPLIFEVACQSAGGQ